MAKNIRAEKVTEFMLKAHDGGVWALNVYSKDGQDVRIAKAAMAYHGLKDSKGTTDAYVSTVRAMLAAGSLRMSLGKFSGAWLVKVVR